MQIYALVIKMCWFCGMYGWGWMWPFGFGWGFGIFAMLFWLAIIVLVVYFIAKAFSGSTTSSKENEELREEIKSLKKEIGELKDELKSKGSS